jgi:membrane-associated phospholipid phosphatase
LNHAIANTHPREAAHQSHARPVSGIEIAVVILLAVAFAALAFAVHSTPYFPFDLSIARALQSIHDVWFATLLEVIAWPGYPPETYVFVVAIAVILWFVHVRWAAVSFIFASLAVGVPGLGIKMLINRPRPSPELMYVRNPALDHGMQSFPAGHVEVYVTLIGFLLFLVLTVRQRRWWHYLLASVMVVMLVLIGPSRIYVGEHWFSDVIGAYLFGALGLWVAIRFYEWGKDRFFTNTSKTTE